MTLKKGHNSTKGDNPDLKKNTGQLFFDEESIYEISKPYLKFVMDGRTDARMDKPKAICPFNFFKVGGIITFFNTIYNNCCLLGLVHLTVYIGNANNIDIDQTAPKPGICLIRVHSICFHDISSLECI